MWLHERCGILIFFPTTAEQHRDGGGGEGVQFCSLVFYEVFEQTDVAVDFCNGDQGLKSLHLRFQTLTLELYRNTLSRFFKFDSYANELRSQYHAIHQTRGCSC